MRNSAASAAAGVPSVLRMRLPGVAKDNTPAVGATHCSLDEIARLKVPEEPSVGSLAGPVPLLSALQRMASSGAARPNMFNPTVLAAVSTSCSVLMRHSQKAQCADCWDQ